MFILLLVILVASGCVLVEPVPVTAPNEAPPSLPTLTSPLPTTTGATVKLPEPRLKGSVSVEETLLRRRSVRDYADAALTLEEVAQLLWAGQGITETWGGRTAPSAGATYPLEIYLVVGNVQNLAMGIYKYNPRNHELTKISEEDVRGKLAAAALRQDFIERAAIAVVIAAVYERTTWRYGDRGIRYVHIEVGHAAQNICLQVIALGLATVPVGAFSDDHVKSVIGMPAKEVPLYILPVGRKIE